MDLITYILNEVKDKRLDKANALDLIHEFRTRTAKKLSRLHPLLHQNISDIYGPRFGSLLTGREFFLSDHVVNGLRVLPGVVYLEMARAAVEQALGAVAESPEIGRMGIRLQNIVWVRPLVVAEKPVRVEIELFPETDGVITYDIYSGPETAEVEPVLHSQGRVALNEIGEAPILNLEDLLAGCRDTLDSTGCYEAFKAVGIDYGPAFRGLREVHVGRGIVMAKLSLPPSVSSTRDQFVLHPSLIDSALQSAIGLPGDLGQGSGPSKPALPFALQELEIYGPCTSIMWSVVRYNTDSEAGGMVEKLDLDICDEQGKVCMRLKGFTARVLDGEMATAHSLAANSTGTPLVGTMTLAPVWDTVPVIKGPFLPALTTSLRVIGGAVDHLRAIRQLYPQACQLEIQSQDTIETIAQKMAADGPIGHIVWIAPFHTTGSATDETLIEAQGRGVLQVFRLIKAMLLLGYGSKELGWTIITTGTQPADPGSMVHPAHASVHGLAGTLAKEYPHWKIRLVDLETGSEWPVDEIFTLQPDLRGEPYVYRSREWFRQKLFPVQPVQLDKSMYRAGGVYVVIGGAGGIGAVWSEYLIRKYRAQIIWIGRRPMDATIQAKLDSLSDPGPAPVYIRADATHEKELREAYVEIKRRFEKINGVIHSAIVLLDKSLANMEESHFMAGLAAKVHVGVRLAQVFQRESLDFVLFFSSFQSFAKAAGQSNYASGCTFKDAFAHRLAMEWTCPVKVINWGYWGSVGIVASKEYQEKMAGAGLGSIEPPEAMEALEMLLTGPINQMALMKIIKPNMMEEFNPEDILSIYPETITSQINKIRKPFMPISDQPEDGLLNQVQMSLRQIASRLLNVTDEELDNETKLSEYGFDPVILNEFFDRLSREFGLELAAASYSGDLTLHRIAQDLTEKHQESLSAKFQDVSAVTESQTSPGADTYSQGSGKNADTTVLQDLSHKLSQSLPAQEMEDHLRRLLWSGLQSVGLFTERETVLSGLKTKAGLSRLYDRWLDESVAVLARGKYLDVKGDTCIINDPVPVDGNKLWAEWEHSKEVWLAVDPSLKNQVTLVETTLRALPDIITGKIPATDIIFPNSSMELVEGIYKHNPVADYFNELLADTAIDYLEERLKLDGSAGVRIIEIGAGTGGTSTMLFRKLMPYREHITEYCYTDISKAFLLFAEKEYGPGNPYLTYQLFDVNWPVVGQGVRAGGYDLAIATNVLHATQNIRRTLRNVKATLKQNGLILINEISGNNLFTHLTFGLLEGWWAYEDHALRIPGCPGLAPETWRSVLTQEGLRSVFFKAPEAIHLGQQIIVAENDGVIRQAKLNRPHTDFPAKQLETPRTHEQPKKLAAIDHLGRMDKPKVTLSKGVTAELLREKSTVYLKKLIAETLKMPVDRIDSSEPLEKYGIDSILVVQLTNTLGKVLSNVTSTLFFEYKNIDTLIDYFIKTQKDSLLKLTGVGEQEENDAGAVFIIREQNYPAVSADPIPSFRKNRRFLPLPNRDNPQPGIQPPAVSGVQDVAIIGLSGRYPQAGNVGEFWKNLQEGRNCITEILPERWNWRDYYHPEKGKKGSIYTKWGGFIDNFDRFDALFFQISPREAEQMDPQERLFLEVAYESIEDAGYTPANLCENRKIGVFVGVMNGNYPAGSNYWSIANRLSYLFDFQGPSMAVDTACSSSLTAIHLALESIYNGTCQCAVAGGVNLIVDPVHYLKLTAMSMLSPEDCCKSFGDRADGFVDGEGVGAVILKPLSKAVENGDHIYGVLKGSMLNSGGKTNGYTVPNPNAQTMVIAEALRRAKVHARTISYVEAHGTGTALGDPIEITGLTRAFEYDTPDKQFCAIGSVKSNIGHCESASGIAGLTKILLQLKNGQLVPSLYARELNPNIDFENTSFVVQQALTEWKRPVVEINSTVKEYPRRAGLSSFGAGGANVHVIIEEYIPQDTNSLLIAVSPGSPVVIPISARNDKALKLQIQRMLAAIKEQGLTDSELPNIAYTFQVGREAMEERLGLVVESIRELEDKLRRYLEGEDGIDKVYRGQAKRNQETLAVTGPDDDLAKTIEAWAEKGKYAKLLSFWVKGLIFDWNKLYRGAKPRRISLPTYPFTGERYWLTGPRTNAHDIPSGTPAGTIHPETDQNISSKFVGQSGSASTESPVPPLSSAPQTAGKAVSFKTSIKPSRIPLRSLAEVQTFSQKSAKRIHKTIPLSSPGIAVPEPVIPTVAIPAVNIQLPVSGEALLEELRTSLAEVLYMKRSEVDPDKRFIDMGMDSIVGVEWLRVVNGRYGTGIDIPKIYEYPGLRQFAALVKGELAKRAPGTPDTREEILTPVPSSQPVVLMESLLEELSASLAAVLYMKRSDVDPDKKFIDMGMDSIIGVEWLRTVNGRYGTGIDIPKIYEYPALRQFTVFLKGELAKRNPNSPISREAAPSLEVLKEVPPPSISLNPLTGKPPVIDNPGNLAPFFPSKLGETESPVSENRDIAVIGLAGRYPHAENMDQFWGNLRNGRDCIDEIPGERWDHSLYYDQDKNNPGKTYCKWGGFLEGVDQFDPLFFNISPREATFIDPHERLFLETVWNLFEGAGYTRESLQRSYQGKVGVYAGAMYQHYHLESTVYGSFHSSIANRVSHFFNLQGPSIAIDTMCSSSAIAIHLACESLIRGECRMAVAGGVNLTIHPKKYLGLSLTKMIGSSRDSRSFGNGDGFLPSEGVGAVLLKPLARAIADQDSILAVIKATAINHGGNSNGYSAPNPNAQAQLIEDNLIKAGIDPRTISYVEAAASGMAVGDSLEVTALAKAFRKFTTDQQFCAIGSVKSNLGHAEAASGISQLTKVILQLQHRQLVPSIKAEPLNPNINFSNTPFYLQSKLEDWKPPVVTIDGVEQEFKRRATVSSFGAGGSNAHLIVEEYIPNHPEPEVESLTSSPQLVVFSAKTRERLPVVVQQVLEFLGRQTGLSLPDLAYTLQVGREAMEWRMAMIVGNQDELVHGMKDYLESVRVGLAPPAAIPIFIGNPNSENGETGRLFSDKENDNIMPMVEDKNFAEIAVHWVKGAGIPWEMLHQNERVRKIVLPTYPFEKRRCWTDSKPEAPITVSPSRLAGVEATTSGSSPDGSRIIGIISRLLGLTPEELNPGKPLVAYGMDSIIWMDFLWQMQTQVDSSLDWNGLRECRTIQDVINIVSSPEGKEIAISGEGSPKISSFTCQFPELIYLNQSSQGRPVFWIHGGAGGVESYKNIAVKSERPFYGIQARNGKTVETPLVGVEAIAAYYRRIIQTVQPEGPYDLGGFSMGGMLAYEITRQLQESGQSVDSIIMVDTLDSAAIKKQSGSNAETSIWQITKGRILQTVNLALLAAIPQDPEKIPQTLIHRDELDIHAGDEEFLQQALLLAKKRGLIKTESRMKTLIEQNARTQQFYELEKYNVLPLPDSRTPACYYFRNKNGRFFGELEPYFTLANYGITLDSIKYWEEWERYIFNFYMMEVDASNHWMMMSEANSSGIIGAFCGKLYSETGITQEFVDLYGIQSNRAVFGEKKRAKKGENKSNPKTKR